MILYDKIELRKIINIPLNKTIILYTESLMEGRGIDTILDASN